MYLALVGMSECEGIRVSVLLIIIDLATQHGCHGTVVLFHLHMGLGLVCRGKHISNFEQVTCTLGESESQLFSMI